MSLADNGFNPFWNETCEMVVYNPFFAFLRFVVQDEDMFGDSNFIGQNTYPVSWKSFDLMKKKKNFFCLKVIALRPGYRSVRLKNGFSEDLELATLLVHIETKAHVMNGLGVRSGSLAGLSRTSTLVCDEVNERR